MFKRIKKWLRGVEMVDHAEEARKIVAETRRREAALNRQIGTPRDGYWS